MRNIYTIVAAHPVEVEYHELPRVRVDSFIVEAATLQAAFDRICTYEGVIDATEVFGTINSDVLICPSHKHRREEPLEDWERWSGMVRAGELGWTHLASSPVTFRELIEKRFAERNQKFA